MTQTVSCRASYHDGRRARHKGNTGWVAARDLAPNGRAVRESPEFSRCGRCYEADPAMLAISINGPTLLNSNRAANRSSRCHGQWLLPRRAKVSSGSVSLKSVVVDISPS